MPGLPSGQGTDRQTRKPNLIQQRFALLANVLQLKKAVAVNYSVRGLRRGQGRGSRVVTLLLLSVTLLIYLATLVTT